MTYVYAIVGGIAAFFAGAALSRRNHPGDPLTALGAGVIAFIAAFALVLYLL